MTSQYHIASTRWNQYNLKTAPTPELQGCLELPWGQDVLSLHNLLLVQVTVWPMRSGTGRVRKNRNLWMNGLRWWRKCYLSLSLLPKEASSLSFPFAPLSLKNKRKGHKVGSWSTREGSWVGMGWMTSQEKKSQAGSIEVSLAFLHNKSTKDCRAGWWWWGGMLDSIWALSSSELSLRVEIGVRWKQVVQVLPEQWPYMGSGEQGLKAKKARVCSQSLKNILSSLQT